MLFKASDFPILFGLSNNSKVWDRESGEDIEVSLLPEKLFYGGPRNYFKTFNIPTQIVIWEPELVAPVQGRIWSVDLYFYCGCYLPWSQMITRPLFENDGTHHQAFVCERWEDHGDDGHTEYALEGYALIENMNDWAHKKVNYWAFYLPPEKKKIL